jgi:hypothetical protein
MNGIDVVDQITEGHEVNIRSTDPERTVLFDFITLAAANGFSLSKLQNETRGLTSRYRFGDYCERLGLGLVLRGRAMAVRMETGPVLLPLVMEDSPTLFETRLSLETIHPTRLNPFPPHYPCQLASLNLVAAPFQSSDEILRRLCFICRVVRGTRRTSVYYCIHCKVCLCASPCFMQFHTVEKLADIDDG